VPRHDVDLVALDLAAEGDLRLPKDYPLPQRGGHPPGVIRVEVEFLGDLLVGEVQPHEVQAQDPDPQRLVVAGEDRPGQVVEPAAAAVALIHVPSAIAELRSTFVIHYTSTSRYKNAPRRRS
jgi:hypothetical protein